MEKSVQYLLSIGVKAENLKGYVLESMDVPSVLYNSVPDIETLPSNEYKSDSDAYNYLASVSSGDVAFVSEKSLKKIRLLSQSAYVILSRYFK